MTIIRTILLLAAVFLLFGCYQQADAGRNGSSTSDAAAPMTCDDYCRSKPLPRCDGQWKAYGDYPACVCEYVCRYANRSGDATQPADNTTAQQQPVGGTPANGTVQQSNASAGASEEELLGNISFWAYQIQDQNEGDNWDILVESHYDMIVVDEYRSISGEEGYDMKGDVAGLRNSTGSRGDGKLVIAYIDVGEAEDYRWYWKSDWRVGNPDWIAAPDPDGWSGNYPVRYWDSEWKNITFDYLDMIIEDGFDGIYLDWVEAYDFEPVSNAAAKEGKSARGEMIDFVGGISEYVKSRKPGFIVIAQNAVELGTSGEYLGYIDGVAQEQIWFDGEADGGKQGDIAMPETGDFSSSYYISRLERFKAAGKPVFSVDYAEEAENVDKAYTLAYQNGYIPYVSVRDLDRLTDTPPPGYQG